MSIAAAVARLRLPAPERGPATLEGHLERYGPLPGLPDRGRPGGRRAAAALIEAVEGSGLRGRGGGAFPTGRKLRAVAERGRRPVVVANGVEAEPASAKDAALLLAAPHLVLDGAAVAAAATGAPEVLVCVRRGAPHVGAAVAEAIRARAAARVDRVVFRRFEVPDRYVAGEETALVRWLNGGPAKPAFTPPRPFERGVRGRPTLVQNAETLAHLALIARYGPEWFGSVGPPGDSGTALLTVGGAVARPGVVEAAVGISLTSAVALAGGPSAPAHAYLVGGYFGTWVPAAEADRIPLVHDPAPGMPALGCGAIVALPHGACGLLETARVVRYLARESAGQCGPCAFGLPAIAGATERLARDGDPGALGRLRRWTAQVAGRGACRHPDAAVRLVASALSVFEDEAASHARGACAGTGRPGPRVLPVGRGGEGIWR